VADALRASPAADPPGHLAPPARNAWVRLHDLHARRGTWRDLYRLDLDALAHACGWYVEAVEACRGLPPGSPVHPDAQRALEASRRRARAGLVEWGYLPPEHHAAARIDDRGFDADLAAICAPLP
jgi:hypothetical protein